MLSFLWQVFDKCMQWRSEGTIKNIFAAPPTKTAEFEVKIGTKAQKKFIFEVIRYVLRARNAVDKAM